MSGGMILAALIALAYLVIGTGILFLGARLSRLRRKRRTQHERFYLGREREP